MSVANDSLRQSLIELLPRLRRFARTLTRNPHDADDIVQIALERALQRSDQWQPGTRLDSWMYRIVKNAWIDEYRARARSARVFAPEEAGADVADAQADQGERLAVEQALQRLPEEQRLTVALVLIEGLPYKQAAAVMDVPIGTLTSRLARARETLQGLLEPGEPT